MYYMKLHFVNKYIYMTRRILYKIYKNEIYSYHKLYTTIYALGFFHLSGQSIRKLRKDNDKKYFE